MISRTSSTLAWSRTVWPFTVAPSAGGTLADGMVRSNVCGAASPGEKATEAVRPLMRLAGRGLSGHGSQGDRVG